MSIRNGLFIGTILLCAVANFGCLVGGSSTVKRDGSYVSDSTLNTIKAGETTQAWVLATLGEPSKKTEIEPGHELWKYEYKEKTSSDGYVFLVFGGSDSKETAGKVFVELKDGVVTKSWRG
jgi:outer membrane protein assembly factor BamE (lipoprotein component of BamABCDE complex)